MSAEGGFSISKLDEVMMLGSAQTCKGMAIKEMDEIVSIRPIVVANGRTPEDRRESRFPIDKAEF